MILSRIIYTESKNENKYLPFQLDDTMTESSERRHKITSFKHTDVDTRKNFFFGCQIKMSYEKNFLV